MFILDKKLESDCFFVEDLKLSRLLLMNNANYPWLILVPKKNNLVEIIDLDFEDQKQLLLEINAVSKILKNVFFAEKLNVANLGNVVKQLHIHVIGRNSNDKSFPKPVWGSDIVQYLNKESEERIYLIKKSLKEFIL